MRIFLVLIVSLSFAISGCNSYYKWASCFSKRKYTKGYFSDPLAKAKVGYTTYIPNNASKNLNQPKHNKFKEVIFPETKISTQVKSVSANRIGIVKGPIISCNSKVSFKENLIILDYPKNENHASDQHSKASKYLLIWLLCLGVALISIVVAFVLALGSYNIAVGVSIALGYFSIAAFLLALVFFILWLTALPQYEGSNENESGWDK